MTVLERIQNYLGNGGLFNPELMEHEKVRDLIMACRDEIATLRQERDDADAYIRAIWRKDALPSPLPDRLFDRLTETPVAVLEHSSDVVVNGSIVGVKWRTGDTYALLVNRALVQAKYSSEPHWHLTDSEGYEIHLEERLDPAEERTKKNLYLNLPAGIGA